MVEIVERVEKLRPLFSCVVPVKGPRPYMAAALESLHSQGMGDDLEIIVQDGDGELFECSECSIVRMKDEGVNIRWEREPDQGQSDALNKGFAKAKGKWFFWLNADDVLLPGALNRTIRTIEQSNNSPVWIAGDMLKIDSAGRCVGASVGNRWHDWLFRHAVPHVHGPSSFFRRELWERVGGCDVSLRYCMDWDLWIRFMQAGARFVRVNDFLWSLRQWEGSKTQGHADAKELARQGAEVKRMLEKNDFRITRGAVWKYKIWRMLCGCYLKAWLEVRRRK